MTTPADPVEVLRHAARLVAGKFAPGVGPCTVAVTAPDGRTVFSVLVPPPRTGPDAAPASAPAGGWVVTERGAYYDGRRLGVAASRLKLLKVLVEADGPLSGKELARLAFDRQTDEEGARYHVKALRVELAKEFPDFEGDIIPGDGGYRIGIP